MEKLWPAGQRSTGWRNNFDVPSVSFHFHGNVENVENVEFVGIRSLSVLHARVPRAAINKKSGLLQRLLFGLNGGGKEESRWREATWGMYASE